MLNKKIGLIALLAGVAAGNMMAGDFNSYAVGDVLVCFRGGAFDLVVDAGPFSTFTNATTNQRITISQYTGDQLALVGTNSVTWSAFTWLGDNSLYVSKPRTSLNVQTSPWQKNSSASQSIPAGRMATIPVGALENIAFNGLNTATAVIEDNISAGNANYPNGSSYHDAIVGSYGGNFNGSFQGNPEGTTLGNFTTSGQVVRSDFYQLTPASFGAGKFLGYFEFNTNGVMTYVAYPTSVPVIQSVSRSGNTSTINYKTGLYGTYTLRGTNSLTSGTAWTNWPAITTLTSGDTVTHITTDTTTDDIRFYTITVQ